MTTTQTVSTGLLQHARDLAEQASKLGRDATPAKALELALHGKDGVALVAGEPTAASLDALTKACDERSWHVFVATGDADAATTIAEKLRRAVIVEHTAAELLRTLPIKPSVAVVCGGDADAVSASLDSIADAMPDGALAVVIGAHARSTKDWRGIGGGKDLALLARHTASAGVLPIRLEGDLYGRLSDLSRKALSEGPTPAPDATMRTPAVVSPTGLGSAKTRQALVKNVMRAREILEPRRQNRRLEGLSRWPWVVPDAKPLPPTMPDGSPWPKITVVTPTYNQGHFIEETILSVIHQGYPNLEHILMDGKSTDHTMEVVDKYRDHFAVIVSEKDKGQSDAINKGFERSTGELLTWINSDDMLTPGALAAAAIAYKTSGASFINGVSQVFREGKLVHQCITSCPDGPMPLMDMLDLENCWLTGQFWWQPDCFFSKELWDNAGAHVRVDWYYSMDYELWLRMAQAGATVHSIGRPICWYRTHADQKTSEGEGEGFRGELPKVVVDHCEKHDITLEKREKEVVKGRLRVVFFNDVGFEYGAGIAQRRLAEAFASAGHDVRVLAATHPEPVRESPTVSATDALAAIDAHDPDLVIIGNVHGADIAPEVLSAITAKHETVFFMHDAWLLTGRETYFGDNEDFLTGTVGPTSTNAGYPAMEDDAIRPAWEAKRRFLTGSETLTILTNSQWLADRAKAALAKLDTIEKPTQDHDAAPFDLGCRPPVHAVRYGLDLDALQPRDKATCRDILGLPQDDFIIMASACSLEDERKGIGYLAKALKQLDLPDATVVGVGYMAPNAKPPIPGMRAMGYMRDAQQLTMLYSACDVFVAPSTDEAFGQVFIEAAACGTPSVGFPVGGVPEAITHGVTGLVASDVSAEALAAAIDTLYRDASYRSDLGQWARIHTQNEWSLWTSYQRLHSALAQSGAGKRIGLSRKIDFTRPAPMPQSATLIRPTHPAYEPRFGFEHWEGPKPEQNLDRFRWLRGPSAAAVLHATRAGKAKLAITCRNTHPGQRIRVVLNGKQVADQPIPKTQPRTDHAITIPVRVNEGANHLQLNMWKWNQGEGRPLAIMLTDLRLIED
ncbi:MAG: glycosyltransferase [Phycisphaera sp.]|nr:MAG: glycosyltransferase [Phycisphaera sp.]